ncbi:MAG: DMT family transporter [Desulfococcaceae bacterium]
MYFRSPERRADLSLLAISVIWGSTFIVTKTVLETVSPFAFLTLRFAVALVGMAVLVGLRGAPRTPGLFRDGALLGAALFCAFAAQTLALQTAAASVVAFVTGLFVVVVPIGSFFVLRKPPRTGSVIGVPAAVAGLGLMTLRPGEGISPGVAFAALSAFGYAVHILLTDGRAARHDPVRLTAVQVGWVFGLSGLSALLLEPTILPTRWSPALAGALLLTGLLATVLAFAVQTAMQHRTTPTKAAILFCMEPVSSLGFSFFLGGERLAGVQYLGAGFILLATLAAELGPAGSDKASSVSIPSGVE